MSRFISLKIDSRCNLLLTWPGLAMQIYVTLYMLLLLLYWIWVCFSFMSEMGCYILNYCLLPHEQFSYSVVCWGICLVLSPLTQALYLTRYHYRRTVPSGVDNNRIIMHQCRGVVFGYKWSVHHKWILLLTDILTTSLLRTTFLQSIRLALNAVIKLCNLYVEPFELICYVILSYNGRWICIGLICRIHDRNLSTSYVLL